MKTELMKIYQERKQKKNQLLEQKNNYFTIIYGNTIRKVPIYKIHRDLFNATINKKHVDPVLFQFAQKLANRAKKLDHNQEPSLLALALIDLFFKKKANDTAKKLINKRLNDECATKKDVLLLDFLEDSRSDNKIFYLASSHNDCAEDHKPYQGKMYIDSDWESIITDEKVKKKVQKYVNKHKVKTYQWVLGAPAWFVTRPHCRHYFVSLPTREVLKSSLKKLKERHKTHSEKGRRDMQTPVTAAIEEYEERLAILKRLYQEFPTEELRKLIEKTELLLKKWKKLL